MTAGAVNAQIGVRDRDSARAFVDERVIPLAEKFDYDGAIPRTFVADVAATGVFGAVVPAAYGGSGLDMVTLGAVHEEFGRGCSSLRSLLTVHTMVAWSISRWGTEAQRNQWLPRLATGEAMASFCLSEVEAGTNTSDIRSSATREPGGWVLRGRKKWITGGQLADLFLVFAKTETGIAAFLVPRDAGVQTEPINDVLGTRACMLAEVVLDSIHVPAEAELGPSSFAPAFLLTTGLDIGRYSLACGSVGIVQACLDACVAYARERRVGDVLLSEMQLTQAKVADMVTSVLAGRELCRRAGRLKDDGDEATIMATWVAKYFASRAAAKAATDAVQLHGANGCTREYPVARYYRDAKIMEIIEGTSEVQQITVGRAALQQGVRLPE